MRLFSKPTDPIPLDRAGLTWFNEVKNRALAVMPAAPAPNSAEAIAVAAVNRIVALPVGSLTQHEVFELENWLAVLLEGDELKHWVNSLREDYRETFGTEAFQRIQPTLEPSVATANNAPLRAEAKRLMGELHWQAGLQPVAQRKKEEMLIGLLLVMGAIGIGCAYYWDHVEEGTGLDSVQFGTLMFLMGSLGGFISSVQRVMTADIATSRAMADARYARMALGVAISPFQGGLFALVLALILVTRLTPAGFVIPEVSLGMARCPCATNMVSTNGLGTNGVGTQPPPNPNSLKTATADGQSAAGVSNPTNAAAVTSQAATANEFNPQTRGAKILKQPEHLGPEEKKKVSEAGSSLECHKCRFPFLSMWLCFGTGKDVALLLLWAFLAGFSERLVPDTLSRIAAKGK